MERDKGAVMEHYAALAPETLEGLTAEERHGLYKVLRLVALVYPDGSLEANWEWEITDTSVCNVRTTGTRSSRNPRRTGA